MGNYHVIAVTYHGSVKEVQRDPALAGLLAAPHTAAPFDRADYWAGLEEECGLKPAIMVARDGKAAAVLPLAEAPDGLGPLANWYSFRVKPLLSPGADGPALLAAIARAAAGRAGRITLAPLPDEQGEASQLAAALRQAGWMTELAACDTNHVLEVGNRSFADYLASRPGQLRTTLKRKAKKVEVVMHHAFDAAAWDDYEAIYGQSWKGEEGSPQFLRRWAEEDGQAGRLRLALAYAALDDGPRQPVAAQFWTLEGGTAFIHKLAYVEAAKPLSPGTTLTAALMEQVIDHDRVAWVDFGTGDDPYKRDWMELARPRYRLTAWRPGDPAQWTAIAKSLIKRLAARIRRG
ncbi:MAG: GNAT family N-acetyltransferase [Proteobacteria bacterium]|nr:GNAT family N-acetyltransferase [Pseudomonadota bacterium]